MKYKPNHSTLAKNMGENWRERRFFRPALYHIRLHNCGRGRFFCTTTSHDFGYEKREVAKHICHLPHNGSQAALSSGPQTGSQTATVYGLWSPPFIYPSGFCSLFFNKRPLATPPPPPSAPDILYCVACIYGDGTVMGPRQSTCRLQGAL